MIFSKTAEGQGKWGTSGDDELFSTKGRWQALSSIAIASL